MEIMNSLLIHKVFLGLAMGMTFATFAAFASDACRKNPQYLIAGALINIAMALISLAAK